MSCNPKTFLNGCVQFVRENPKPYFFIAGLAALFFINPLLALSAVVLSILALFFEDSYFVSKKRGTLQFKKPKISLLLLTVFAITAATLYHFSTTMPESKEDVVHTFFTLAPISTSIFVFSILLLFVSFIVEFFLISYKDGAEVLKNICQKGQAKA